MTTNKGITVVAEDVEVQPVQEIVTAYVDPDSVFNELPQITAEFITDLCKDKFSKEILAIGPMNDSKMAGFRNAWLVDTVSAAHKQLMKLQAARSENRARDLYKQLRSRGIAPAEASKASGYNPLT
jgi:hypothetical protein